MTTTGKPLRIGLIVNPLAGIGGAVALKGSDGEAVVREALARGAEAEAPRRAARALAVLADSGAPVELFCWAGAMGEDSAREAGLVSRVVGRAAQDPTGPEDTREAARALLREEVELLLFAGGDGTARDICDVVGERVPVLGIPAGCKMHSGVYAVNPEAAGQLLVELAGGDLVSLMEGEVRDIDEEAFRQGRVSARYYGSLRVPAEHRYIQQVKSGGRESEALVLTEIAAGVVEEMDPGVSYLMGSGSTVGAVMEELGLANTLLGVDQVRDGELVRADLGAAQLRQALDEGPARAVLGIIGGQGHLFGRGNQQFAPDIIRRLGRDGLIILATHEKLKALEGRPLLVDTGDAALDQELCGLLPVRTGYEEQVLYRVDTEAGVADTRSGTVAGQP